MMNASPDTSSPLPFSFGERRQVQVRLNGHAIQYPILIQRGILSQCARHLPLPANRKIFLVHDSGLPLAYLQQVSNSLMTAGYCLHVQSVPKGEGAKSLPVLEGLYQTALKKGFTRHDAFMALGGGVVGDLTGYLAATYYRGAGFIQIPTTLLAQVDSSVGGKTAINFGEVKNCIGAFKQPDCVLIDPNTLETLTPRELRAGLAELFKYALIEKTALNAEGEMSPENSALGDEWLWDAFLRLKKNWPNELERLIEAACAVKAAVVMRDELERFPKDDARGRVCLNLGHTFAHAYEAFYGYGELLHGEAVAIGMLCALFANADALDAALLDQATKLMDALGILPYEAIARLGIFPDASALLPIMAKDKKTIESGRLRLVLPEGTAGRVIIQECSAELASKGIEQAQGLLKAMLP